MSNILNEVLSANQQYVAGSPENTLERSLRCEWRI